MRPALEKRRLRWVVAAMSFEELASAINAAAIVTTTVNRLADAIGCEYRTRAYVDDVWLKIRLDEVES